jgi:hypothetical protein
LTTIALLTGGGYSKSMELVRTTPAPEPRSKDVAKIAILYAVIVTVMAVAQLFTFETFLQLIEAFGLPGGRQTAYVLGSLLVVSEVFALPFLLRFDLSPAFRWVCMGFSWLVAAIWLFVTLWVTVTNAPVVNVGFLGTVVDVMPGWGAVLISFALGILAAWASWGLWPRLEKK